MSALRHRAEEVNRHRTEEAREYFTRLSSEEVVAGFKLLANADGDVQTSGSGAEPTVHGVKVAIAVISVKRSSSSSSFTLGYVIQSVAALHSLLRHQKGSEDLFRDTVLFICNVDPEPGNHSDVAFLKDLGVHVVERYGTSSMSAVNVSSLTIPGLARSPPLLYRQMIHDNVYDKERVDYMFCLQAASRLHPAYVLLVEDDAVALPDMPAVLQHALDRLSTRLPGRREGRKDVSEMRKRRAHNRESSSSFSLMANSEGGPAKHQQATEAGEGEDFSDTQPTFAYLKLFFPLRWQGYAFELTRLLDLTSTAVLLTTLTLICCWGLSARSGRPVRGRTIMISAMLSLLLCLLLGRQNVDEVRRLSRHFYRLQQAPQCCTPAVLYPSDVIPSLLTSLAGCRSKKHVDLCIADFVTDSALPAYSLEPNLFSHVGMVTSLNMGDKHPEDILFYHNHLVPYT